MIWSAGLAAALATAPALAAPGVEEGKAAFNQHVRVETIVEEGRTVGLAFRAGEQPLGVMRIGPRGLIAAGKVETAEEEGAAILRLSDLQADDAGAKLGAESKVTVRIVGESRWPRVAFDVVVEAFDAEKWTEAVGGTFPFHHLLWRFPGATMFYQGGGLIPSPEVDPFPMSAQGYMAGNWAEGWSYAPAMAGWALPAVGLWDHKNGSFVAYDFTRARHTDRSSKHIASAYCLGYEGEKEPFFCLVQPYQRGWVELTWPKTPSRAASQFELIYSREMVSTRDPNMFVVQRTFAECRDLLPPAPKMNDLGWIPDYDTQAPGDGIPRTSLGAHVMGPSGPTGLAGIFVELGAKMLGNPFISDSVLRAYGHEDEEALARLREQLDYLCEHATWETIDGDRCCTWVHPIEGKFQDRWGGERCAGNHHPSTWHIGTAMLLAYERDGEKRYLEFVDGVYNWTRHYLFTRNGVCDLPWAMFSRVGTAAAENFLLNYRRVFRTDARRKQNLDEALELARMSLYKVLWFYLADPDLSDDLDPTFLNQAVNDRRWCGRVTWNECGWVVRTLVPMYCETGDPVFAYLLRGALERYYAGFREDGGIAENIQIFGEIEPKGLRTAGFPDTFHGGNVRRWARPVGDAAVRVVVGARGALAFCKDTRGYDVAEYRYAPERNFAFRLAAGPTAPADRSVDIIVTAPFRDLREKPIKVNGKQFARRRYEHNPATDGEDVYLWRIKPGDVVEIGDVKDAPVIPPPDVPWRTAAPQVVGAGYRTVDLGPACTTALNVKWFSRDSWAGLAPGLRYLGGIPVALVDPELAGGKQAVEGAGVALSGKARTLFAVFGAQGRDAEPDPAGICEISVKGGEPREITVATDLPADLCNGFPLREWEAYLGVCDFGEEVELEKLEVKRGTLLAATIAQAGPPLGEALTALERRRGADPSARYECQWPTEAFPHNRIWGAEAWQKYRFRLEVLPSGRAEQDALVRVKEDFGALLEQAGYERRFDPTTPTAIECDAANKVVGGAQVQFDTIPGSDHAGELLLVMPGETGADQTRYFDVYFGYVAHERESQVLTNITEERVSVETGPGGLRFEFDLRGEGPAPRWTWLSFDRDGDGDWDEEANALGPSGHNGGLAGLTCVSDPIRWYDFGRLQEEPAKAEIVRAGPIATTIKVSGLQLWGGSDERPLPTVGPREEQPAPSPKGTADWHFRFYAGKPWVEQWVEHELTKPVTGWTRPLQVRYGLNLPATGGTHSVGGVRYAQTEALALTPLDTEATRDDVRCSFTSDGPVLDALIGEPKLSGRYFADRWLALPGGLGEEAYVAAATGRSVKQFAVEQREGDGSVRPEPKKMERPAYDSTGGRGPKPRPETKPVPAIEGLLNLDPSFEEKDRYWQQGPSTQAGRWTEDAYTGEVGADLTSHASKISLVQTSLPGSRAMGLEPNREYSVSFWAKCLAGEGQLHVNFYSSRPGCDFPQRIVDLPADSEWHQYEVTVPTGDLPQRPAGYRVFWPFDQVTPSLRLWSYQRDQIVLVDQVEVRPGTEDRGQGAGDDATE